MGVFNPAKEIINRLNNEEESQKPKATTGGDGSGSEEDSD